MKVVVVVIGMVIRGVVVVKMMVGSVSMLVHCSCYGCSRGGSFRNGFVLVCPCWLIVVGMVVQGVVVFKMCLF